MGCHPGLLIRGARAAALRGRAGVPGGDRGAAGVVQLGGGRVPALAAVEERDTTCCYARQDKFWVKGAPDGERWEIYTVLEDSPTFWGADGSQGWDAAAAELDDARAAALRGRAGVPGGDRGAADEQAGVAAQA